MEQENLAILARELDRLKNEIRRVPFGTIAFSLTIHNGKISRVLRSIETSEKTAEAGEVRR